MVRKQSSSVQVYTTPVIRRKKLPDRITCGICKKDLPSPRDCTDHMKMHSRARSATTPTTTTITSSTNPSSSFSSSSSFSKAEIPRSSFSAQRPKTSGPRLGTSFQDVGRLRRGDPPSAQSARRILSALFLGRETQRRGASSPPPPPSSPLQRQRGGSAKAPSPSESESRSCFFCQAVFPDVRSLTKHTRTHGGATPYSCTRCGRMFALYSSLMIHERSHAPDRFPPCRCQRCGAVFQQESALKAHRRRHVEAKKKEEKDEEEVEEEKGPGVSKPYQCVTCHEWVSNQGSLRIHMQRHETMHTGRTCTLCGAAFSSDAILRAHVRLHDAEPTSRCVICIRPFRRSRVLLRHSDVHADERQNVCDACEKRFPKVADGSWRRMWLLLPDERQFRCLYCSQRFGRLYQLAAHEAGHTDLPPTTSGHQHIDLSTPVVVVVN